MKDLGLENRRIFLTGGSGGIGSSIKNGFEQAGATVFAPDLDELELTNSQSIAECTQKYNGIDVFVHCAGLNILSGIEEITPDIMHTVFEVNLHSAVALMHAFAGHMKQQQWGRVVLISSLYGLVSRERRIAYSTSKTALLGLARTLTLELAQYNILTNCVAPGYVMTEMTRKNLSDQEIRNIEHMIPTNRFQQPDEIADMVVFLCSKLNQSISGQTIAVDGGFLCR